MPRSAPLFCAGTRAAAPRWLAAGLLLVLVGVTLMCGAEGRLNSDGSLCYRGFSPFNDKTCKGLKPQLLIASAEQCAAHCATQARECFAWTFVNATLDDEDNLQSVPVCSTGYCKSLHTPSEQRAVGCLRAVPQDLALREKALLLPLAQHMHIVSLNRGSSSPALAVINDTAMATVLYNATGYTMQTTVNETLTAPAAILAQSAAVGLDKGRIAIIGGVSPGSLTTTTTATPATTSVPTTTRKTVEPSSSSTTTAEPTTTSTTTTTTTSTTTNTSTTTTSTNTTTTTTTTSTTATATNATTTATNTTTIRSSSSPTNPAARRRRQLDAIPTAVPKLEEDTRPPLRGDEELPGQAQGSMLLYFHRNNTWKEVAPATLPALAGHVAARAANGSIFIGFGRSNTSSTVRCFWESRNGAWNWEPLHCPEQSPVWPSHSPAVVTLGDHLLVIGGRLADGSPSDKIWIRDAGDGSWSIAGVLVTATAQPTAVVFDDNLVMVSNANDADVWLYNIIHNASIVLPFPYGFSTWPPSATNVARLGLGTAVVADTTSPSAWVYTMVNPPSPPPKHSKPWAQQHVFAVVVGVFIVLASVAAIVAFFMPKGRAKKKKTKANEGKREEEQPLVINFE